MDAPSGSLIAYAAGPGKTATDGDGENSPYTLALAQTLVEPGLKVEEVFKRVRIRVEEQTGEDQTPWENTSLKGDFYFVPADDDDDTERTFWDSIKNSRNPAKFRAYLEKYGDDAEFAALARIELVALDGGVGAEAALAEEAAPTAGADVPVVTETEPAAATHPSQIFLASGISLADWALLAEDRLTAGDHARLLAEANAHLREYGQYSLVTDVRDRAVAGLVASVSVTTKEDARTGLRRIEGIEASVGPRPELLRLKARAHRTLGEYASADAAYVQWLQLVPQPHPDRRKCFSPLSWSGNSRPNEGSSSISWDANSRRTWCTRRAGRTCTMRRR